MHVRQRTYRDAKGRNRKCSRWQVVFQDHRRRRASIPAFTSKSASLELGRKVERLAAAKVVGEALSIELARWIEGLPSAILGRLVKIGLVAKPKAAAARPLREHLEDYRVDLASRAVSPRYVRQTMVEVRAVIEGIGARFYSEIEAGQVQHFLADRRTGQEGVSHRTSNSYLKSTKRFCRWMQRQGRATTNPLEFARGLNPEVDRRRRRRALTVEEMRWLLRAAADGPDRSGMSGSERALVYHFALTTGLRVNELRTLTVSSFDLDGPVPTVTVEAAYSKHRRDDVLPLRPKIADELRRHLALKAPAAKAFRVPERPARMLRQDLAAARREWLNEPESAIEKASRERSGFLSAEDSSGRVVDFHALRHAFISGLARAGVHPKTAQVLARHSDISLTMNVYSHVADDEQVAALSKLPDLSPAPVRGATG